MIKLQFLGASGTVTGSSYLLKGKNNESVLIDLGMFQGIDDEKGLNVSPLPFDAKNLQAVFLTHAHLDHCGRLPLLIKIGFQGKIYTTEATKMITQISLLDTAAVQEEKDNPPLYTREEVEKICEKIETMPYDKPNTLGEFTVTFRNAGHILGSASIEIADNNQTIVFSGDLGNTPENLIQPMEYVSHADTVIMESTYGNSVHPKEDAVAVLQKEIKTIESTNGVLLIPAFSIQRTQEILHTLSQLVKNNEINTTLPVFLDSPMAIDVTQLFKKFSSLYSDELSCDPHPFDFPNLIYTRSVEESKEISRALSPKIIIAGSGMMNGGRILHHLNNYISIPTTRVLIVGYQAVGTLGREILEGAKFITLYQKRLQVKATITKLEAFSSHADQPQLIQWLQHIKNVRRVFLVHGEDAQRIALRDTITKDLGIQMVILPKRGDIYEINLV